MKVYSICSRSSAAKLESGILPSAAALAAWAAALPVWYLQKMAELLSRLPFASVGTDSIYLRLWLLLGYALLLLWLFWRGEQKRMLLPVGAGGLCLCAALLLTAASRTSGRLSVSVLDVKAILKELV